MTSPPPPPPLRFSSYSLLEGGDTAAGSLGLPTGALFAPFSELQPPPPRIPRQPVLCTFCSAYPSPFCRVDPGTGRWRCCFCEKENPCYAEDFIGSSPADHRGSFPEMVFKAVEYAEQDLSGVLNGLAALSLATGPQRRRNPATAAAVAPAHVLVVDGNMREEALADLSRSVDEVFRTVDPEALISLVVFTGVVSVYRLGRAGAAVADVLPGEETLPEQEVDRRLSEDGGDQEHFLPVRVGRDALCTILKLLRGVGGGGAPAGGNSQAGQRSGANGSSNGAANPAAAASNVNGNGNGGAASAASGRRKAWERRRRPPVPAHRRRRCLGAAVEYALRLARRSGRPTARLLVCLGGCPNFGPGAVAPCTPGAASAEVDPEALAAATDYFEDLGEKALAQGTGVDVFCASSEGLGAAALQGLVAPTSGYVVIQPSFEREFAGNLAKSVKEQTMSDGDGLHGCVIDVRASSGVELLHVIGPAESTEDYDFVDKEAEKASNAAARTAEVAALPGLSSSPSRLSGRSSPTGVGNPTNEVGGSGLGRTHHRLVTGRADPRTSLSLYFGGPPKTPGKGKGKRRGGGGGRSTGAAAATGPRDAGEEEEEDEDEHVVFQFVIRRSSPAGDGRITRVVTHRLPVTNDGHGFLQTVDPEALAVLIGKEAVLRATFGTESGTNQQEVEEARVAVDTVVQEISSRFRDFRKRKQQQPPQQQQQQPRRRPSGDRARGDGVPTASSLADAEGGSAGDSSIASPPALGAGSESSSSRRTDKSGTGRGAAGGAPHQGGSIARPEDAVFPRELGRLPLQLFHLRRGPLLGPLLQNSDDPLCLRHLFLRGALEECLRMMEPTMVSLKAAEALQRLPASSGGSGEESKAAAAAAAAVTQALSFESVPVETLAMLKDRVLVLDTHDHVFVWSGADVCGEEFEPVRAACGSIFSGAAGSRYPHAPVVFLKDGTSWSRYLTSRLIPSHKDPPEEQLKAFPGLAGVPPAELELLRAKLPPTDDESYREFFWDVCDPNFQ